MNCELLLIRKEKQAARTIGVLFLNNIIQCTTLEDTDRGLDKSMSLEEIKIKKVYGSTSIPTGEYEIVWEYSPKFNMELPTLVDVPGYKYIRIHSGNTEDDVRGCIVVGNPLKNNKLKDSRAALTDLIQELKFCTKIKLTIKSEYFV